MKNTANMNNNFPSLEENFLISINGGEDDGDTKNLAYYLGAASFAVPLIAITSGMIVPAYFIKKQLG